MSEGYELERKLVAWQRQNPEGSGGAIPMPNEEFLRFGNWLREYGNVDMASLEDDLRAQLETLLLEKQPVDLDELARLLLLRYCLIWTIAESEDPPPLVGDDWSAAYEIMPPHREQLASYAADLPTWWRQRLTEPEIYLDAPTVADLKKLVQTRREARAALYLPAPLFSEASLIRLDREHVTKQAASKAAMWGKDNMPALMGASRRARYWMDRLVMNAGLETGKLRRSKS